MVAKPKNLEKPRIKIHHRDLERYGDSPYKSKCPSCLKGILLVYRDQVTLKLEENDRCISCGQAFIYTDIAALRRKDES